MQIRLLVAYVLYTTSILPFDGFFFIQSQLYLYLSTVLAQRGFFKEQSFVNYLKYLLYWKKPEYAKFLKWVEVFGTNMQKNKIMLTSNCSGRTKSWLLIRHFFSNLMISFPHRYPQCLHFLELLQYEHFRRELVNPACAKFIDEQQILHWQYYSRRRMRISVPKASGQTGSGSEAEPS